MPLARLNMRMWRNWQTRTVQVRVSNIVKVRVLSSAPHIQKTVEYFNRLFRSAYSAYSAHFLSEFSRSLHIFERVFGELSHFPILCNLLCECLQKQFAIKWLCDMLIHPSPLRCKLILCEGVGRHSYNWD